jgi:opacity protein-like surface antigen
MPVSRKLLARALLVWIPFAVQAENMQLDVNLGWTSLDAGGNDEFKSGNALALHYNYFLKHWLAVDTGLYVSDKTLEESRKDIVGDFRTSVQSQAILLGVKPRYKFSTPYELYGRLGLQYWRTELEVEEFFGAGIPEGTDSAIDTGYGYYVSIGGGYYVTDNIMVQLELRHMTQLDVFQGKSDFPFDLVINSLSIGVGYRF